MAESIFDEFDEKGIIKPEHEMSFEQKMAMNTNNDSVENPINNLRSGSTPKFDAFYADTKKYKTCDGKDVATMEEVMQYNQMFYDSLKNEEQHIENSGIHR